MSYVAYHFIVKSNNILPEKYILFLQFSISDLRMGREGSGTIPCRDPELSLYHYVKSSHRIHPASYPIIISGYFRWSKAVET
jgi:hypothetical protein